jgi:hypothetical protein
VLVDICLDLGIVPEQMDRDTWEELIRDLFLYRGKLPALLHRRESSLSTSSGSVPAIPLAASPARPEEAPARPEVHPSDN